MLNSYGTATLTDCTVSGNLPPPATAEAWSTSASGTTTLANTIVAENIAGYDPSGAWAY